MKKEKQKRRHTWKSKHLRKHRFSFKGIRWKAEWYWYRESYCNEDHEQRRVLEKQALQKIMKGWDEEELYFPRKWRHRPFYWW
jgi:hypothetical protein